MKYLMSSILAALPLLALSVDASVEDLMNGYLQQGAGPFSAQAGESAWSMEIKTKDKMDYRSCANCHGSDPRQPGEHVKTGKRIEPMAVSANTERFSDAKKVEKWFRRNCRWTYGRDCTVQEKGDFLQYLMSR